MTAAVQTGEEDEDGVDSGVDWLDIRIDCPSWNAVSDIAALSVRAAEAALHVSGVDPTQVEISMLFADDEALAGLNSRFRSKENATNVLSWPSIEFEHPATANDLTPSPFFLGDVALAFETVRNEADAGSKPLEEHLTHLIVHGVLHLLGHDHQDEGEAALMEAQEITALQRLGYGSPYGDSSEDGAAHRD